MLDESKLTQAEAANVLGVTQPKVSALRHYKLAGFSVERLMTLLTALNQRRDCDQAKASIPASCAH